MAVSWTSWADRALRWRRFGWARFRGILLRTGVLLLAAALLLLLSRNNVPGPVIVAASTFYLVAATLWVRGQYAGSLTREGLWTPHPLLSLGFLVVFATVLAVGWRLTAGWAVIGGLVGSFFSLGYCAMALRQEGEHRGAPDPEWREWFRGSVARWSMVLAGLAVVAGVGLVAGTRWEWTLVLLAVGAVLLPLPVSVLTSRLHQHLVRRADDQWRGWVLPAVSAGLVLAVAGTLLALGRVDFNPLMGAAVAVLALLVVALVSSTYADIAAVVAVIAALGVTPQQHSSDAVEGPEGKEDVLVAFGDSYMSGEGAQVFHEETDTDGNHCRRAPTAFAEMAGQLTPFDGFISFACSGARTYNVNRDDGAGDTDDHHQYPHEQFPGIQTQLDAYDDAVGDPDDPRFIPKLVLVGLGGNDAGFSTIGAMCLAPGNCGGGAENDRDAHPEEDDGDGEDLLVPNLPLVEEQLRITFDEISATFEGVPVAVVGYPDVVYSPERSGPEDGEAPPAAPPTVEDQDPRDADCSGVPLSRSDIDFVEDFLTELNDAVEAAAVDAGFYYVADMESALADAHLQLCDPSNGGRTGLNIIGLRSVPGEANERFHPKNWYHNSLHPNEAGHTAMLYAFQRWLHSHDDGSPPAVVPGHPRGGAVAGTDREAVAAARAEADCLLYDPDRVADPVADDRPLCESAGYRWAVGEVRSALFFGGWWAVVYLLVAAGVWLLAVTFFAWHKRYAARPLGGPSDPAPAAGGPPDPFGQPGSDQHADGDRDDREQGVDEVAEAGGGVGAGQLGDALEAEGAGDEHPERR